MAALGHEVMHVSAPVTPAFLLRWRQPAEQLRLRRWWDGGDDIDGVRNAVPSAWLTWVLARATGNPVAAYGKALTPSLQRLLSGRDFLAPDIVFIDEPRLVRALDLLGTHCRVIYRATDLYAAIRRDDTILDAERQLIARSNAFIATSQPVADHLLSLGARRVTVIENGVDFAHFETGHDLDVEALLPQRPRAVYAGAFDHRFGTSALRAAALRNTHVSFVLIGPMSGGVRRALHPIPNVHILGAVAYQDLPSYLRRCQIALLPMATGAANEGRSPMKLFEYAAAGLHVVASRTSELTRRKLGFVTLVKDPEEFAEKVAAVAEHRPDSVTNAHNEARHHDWAEKCRLALEITSSPSTE
jgi:teichuronic acid biosynthesis glycosyltransferase TuaH